MVILVAALLLTRISCYFFFFDTLVLAIAASSSGGRSPLNAALFEVLTFVLPLFSFFLAPAALSSTFFVPSSFRAVKQADFFTPGCLVSQWSFNAFGGLPRAWAMVNVCLQTKQAFACGAR